MRGSLHVGKLEHYNRPLIMFAFQYLHFCASGDKLSSKAGHERYDSLHVFLILRFVFDRVLDNKISGHNEPLLAMLWQAKTHVSMPSGCVHYIPDSGANAGVAGGPPRGLCHEHRPSTRQCATVREMKEGPSSSAIRCRSQATASCCRQKR